MPRITSKGVRDVKKSRPMPGFTAEASLYRTDERYSAAMNWGVLQDADGEVRPQFLAARWLARATGPYGPIGLPGQDCSGACWHICMSFPSLNCMENCTRTCRDFAFV
jgi:hypothetical protein